MTTSPDEMIARWNRVAPTYAVNPVLAGSLQWVLPRLGLTVVATIELHSLQPWAHVSFSRQETTPDYTALQFVREWWIGEKTQCLMVFPPIDQYVNLHPHCLHLYACLSLSGDGLPKFNLPADLLATTVNTGGPQVKPPP